MTEVWLPDLRRWPRPLPSNIAKAMGRAHRVERTQDEALQQHFSLANDRWSWAAICRMGEATLPSETNGLWLRADPAYIRPDINGARLLGVGDTLPMTAEDVEAFAPAIREVCDAFGFELQIPHPQRWYLRGAVASRVPAFSLPMQALGEDVFEHTPRDDDARMWRHFANEVQMALHAHPRNVERARRGWMPINAVWCWGAGEMPDTVNSDLRRVHSDDALLRGLGRLANIHVEDAIASWPLCGDNALMDLRGLDGEALMSMMSSAQTRMDRKGMTWTLPEGPAFRITPNDRWKFWRPAWTMPAR